MTGIRNWRKSTYSGNESNCVEVGSKNVDIAVRDTKLGESSPVLAFGSAQWRTFIASTKANGFTA
ncbi:DUF397 domain-containing protein [Fodinicola acaciae]|uniref:DUF397 domain-containing protein n=1 Tax=Fodinicola acaciae TaxID=2681555 RepID=UPI0013D6CEFB|nr:DUF397 domain-containing protein [Fodinicola acaciae]